MPSSLKQKIGFASLIMMASILLSRVIGLVREMVIAGLAGTSWEVDAYQVAFILPEILNHIAASGFLSVTFIPIFSTYLAKGRAAEGWEVFSNILNSFGALLVLAITVAWIFTPALIDWLAPGRTDALFKTATVRMTRIILPAQFFFFCGGLFMAVQFAREHFFIPALAPLIYNIGIILGGVCLAPRFGMEGFAWGVLAGAFTGNFALQWLGAKRSGMVLKATFNPTHPEAVRYILLTLPLVLGLTMTFSTEVFFKWFGSYLPQGHIAALNYAMRIMMMVVAFFGQAVGVATFPFMARLAAEGRLAEMNRLLNQTLRLLMVVIPFAVLVMVLRREVVVVLFQRGAFDAAATDLTARALLFLLIGAVAFATQGVVNRGFYAQQNTLLPALFGTLTVLLSLPLYWIGLQLMGIAGIALAVSLSALLQVTVLFLHWNRRSENREACSVYIFLAKVLLFSAAMGMVLQGFHWTLLSHLNTHTFKGNLVVMVLTTLLFLALLYGGARLLRIEEVTMVTQKLTHRLLKR